MCLSLRPEVPPDLAARGWSYDARGLLVSADGLIIIVRDDAIAAAREYEAGAARLREKRTVKQEKLWSE